MNKEVAENMEPWVEEKHRKRAKAEREKEQLLKERKEKLDQLAKEIAAFNETSKPVEAATSELNSNDEQSFKHPDVMQEYYEKVRRTRVQYAKELAESKLQKEREEMEKKQSVQNDASQQTDEERREAEMKRLQAEREEKARLDQSLKVLERYAAKSLSRDHLMAKKQEQIEKQKKDLAILYHSAESFISPDRLDEEIERCLNNPLPYFGTVSKSLQQLQKSEIEKRMKEREMQLYDSLNDTLMQKPSVEQLQEKRRQEFEAFAKQDASNK